MHSLPYGELNTQQFQAVTASLGNLLVLAGAGSGKTKVLVSRIAFLVEQLGCSPSRMLAVTFTNKAAQEMKHRLKQLLPEHSLDKTLWVGTFHSLAYRILRIHSHDCGLASHFQVIDSDDQLRLIRRALAKLSIPEDNAEPKQLQSFINRKKDEGIRPDALPPPKSAFESLAFSLYRQYEILCQEAQVLDFAEILLCCYEALLRNPDLLAHYQGRFQHLLVDEFQDTNAVQYRWLSLLSGRSQSVTIVGDDDQSIYGWRGAKIENIHRFAKEFPNTQTVRLERNYRSTKTILAAANALIANNQGRLGKELWTEGQEGERIYHYQGFNEEDEAIYVVRKIREWQQAQRALKEVAILYRSNAQSRVLEEAFVRAGIPYVIYGGVRFFERSEIKDALAYARLGLNPHDNAAFERVINVPSRGLGDKTFEKIRAMAQTQQSSYLEAGRYLLATGEFGGKMRQGMQSFLNIVENLSHQLGHLSLPEWMNTVVTQSGLVDFYLKQKGEQAQSRVENLQELVNASHDFEVNYRVQEDESTQSDISDNSENSGNTGNSVAHVLMEFMAYTTLEGGESSPKSRQNKFNQAVQLMTLHAAKGLEFPLVFICGMEEGLFPSHFSRYNPDSIEEERRLCYVGITRAMEVLHLTSAKRRRLFGRDEERRPSCFLAEIPGKLLQQVQGHLTVQAARFDPSSTSSSSDKPQNPWLARWTNTTWSRRDHPSLNPENMALIKPVALQKRIRHPKFGAGTILEQEGEGDNARLHIHFDLYGSKWLALAFAKLEPMEGEPSLVSS